MNDLTYTPPQAIIALKEGCVGVMLTDTVYGLVAAATNSQAVTRLYLLKDRQHKPGTVIAASADQLRSLGIAQSDIDPVIQYWPGPVSAILPVSGNNFLHQGVGSLAVRIVADPAVAQLLEQTGPLLTTSANLPGQPEATTIKQAYDYFGDSVDFYIEGGVASNRRASTVIRPGANGIEVLRQGNIRL